MMKKPKILFELAVLGWRTVTAKERKFLQDERTTFKEGRAALVAFIPQFHSHFCSKVATACCLRGDCVARSSLPGEKETNETSEGAVEIILKVKISEPLPRSGSIYSTFHTACSVSTATVYPNN